MKKYKYDIVLILGIFVVAVALFLVMQNGKKKGAMVIVMVDGKEKAEFPLKEDLEYTIHGVGGENILQLENGKASIITSDCKNQICVRQKAICMQGETITCLPHKVIVEVVSGKENELDGVSK